MSETSSHESTSGTREYIRPTGGFVGKVVGGNYRVTARIGAGGMGEVYKAQDTELDRPVAIKFLKPELCDRPEYRKRFLQDSKAASQLRHDNVVYIITRGVTDEGVAYFVMEYLEGRDLGQLLAADGPLPWARARDLVGQVVCALGVAHAHGIIHRDMKPENCVVVPRHDGGEQVKVIDFGIAKMADVQGLTTQTGQQIGTPYYMAPEQLNGETPLPSTDVYAVGIMLYELLTGEVPFSGRDARHVFKQHLFDRPRPPSEAAPHAGIHADVDALVLKALAKEPGDRFENMEVFGAAILAVGGEGGLGASGGASRRTATTEAGAAKARTGRRGLFAGLIVGAAVVAAIAYWGMSERGGLDAGAAGAVGDAGVEAGVVDADAAAKTLGEPIAPGVPRSGETQRVNGGLGGARPGETKPEADAVGTDEAALANGSQAGTESVAENKVTEAVAGSGASVGKDAGPEEGAAGATDHAKTNKAASTKSKSNANADAKTKPATTTESAKTTEPAATTKPATNTRPDAKKTGGPAVSLDDPKLAAAVRSCGRRHAAVPGARVSATVVVRSGGRVDVSLRPDSQNHTALGRCVTRAVKAVKFSGPTPATTHEFRY